MEAGMEKGKEEASKAIALNMLEIGVDINAIVKSTGLDQSIIERLLVDNKKA